MEIAAVLGSRVIGIGYKSLRMYHAVQDISTPPSVVIFEKIHTDVVSAVEIVAMKSMDNANKR